MTTNDNNDSKQVSESTYRELTEEALNQITGRIIPTFDCHRQGFTRSARLKPAFHVDPEPATAGETSMKRNLPNRPVCPSRKAQTEARGSVAT